MTNIIPRERVSLFSIMAVSFLVFAGLGCVEIIWNNNADLTLSFKEVALFSFFGIFFLIQKPDSAYIVTVKENVRYYFSQIMIGIVAMCCFVAALFFIFQIANSESIFLQLVFGGMTLIAAFFSWCHFALITTFNW